FHFSYYQALNRKARSPSGSRARRARAAQPSSPSARRPPLPACDSRRACCTTAGGARRSAIPPRRRTWPSASTREPPAGAPIPTFPFRSCIMSYVCLWSPSWPTGADFPADLVASLLSHAPRVAVGERGLVWGDARGLIGSQLAAEMLRVAADYDYADTHAGVAMT